MVSSIRNEERVVISTATINLQKQLVDKDIPIVQKLFKKKTKAVLVKGRGNYLCRTRLREAIDEEGLFAAEGDEHPLRRIEGWAEPRPLGTARTSPSTPRSSSGRGSAPSPTPASACAASEREGCFVLRARREASDAQVIVANHHILFADLAARMNGAGYENTAVLPAFRALVLDEAHAVESSATGLLLLRAHALLGQQAPLPPNASAGQPLLRLVPRLLELRASPPRPSPSSPTR